MNDGVPVPFRIWIIVLFGFERIGFTARFTVAGRRLLNGFRFDVRLYSLAPP